MTRHVHKRLKVQFDGVNLKFNFALAANFRHSPGLTGMTCSTSSHDYYQMEDRP